jgi:gentisate 1,2-dioxygenase
MATPQGAVQGAIQQDFLDELERASLDIPGSGGRPVVRPKDQLVQPHLWSHKDMQRLLRRSEHVALGERRMLRLMNPGTPDWKYVTPTLSVSLQQILPGEQAIPHRHTASAIRFFISGSAYTTVEQDRCDMEPGDLIVTPGWEWHDYACSGNEPGVWIDALDLPIVQYLDSCGYLASLEEDIGYQLSNQPRLDYRAAGITERRFSAVGLKPLTRATGTSERAGLIHYRWKSTYPALKRLAEQESDPHDDVMMEYINPENGKSIYPTFACCIQMIKPQVKTLAHRHSSCAVYYVHEGKGQSVINGQVFDWSAGDFFVVPSFFWHEHANNAKEPAVLFSLQDFPLMKNLGLYLEEAHPQGHQQIKN